VLVNNSFFFSCLHDRATVRSGAEISLLSLRLSVSQGASLGDFLLAPACPIEKVTLWECDQPGKNPLKYSAVAGNRTRATGRTDSELSGLARARNGVLMESITISKRRRQFPIKIYGIFSFFLCGVILSCWLM